MSYSNSNLEKDLTNTFKIGVVSRITNIPVDTLRIWERRYSVVVPDRSEKADRLYRREDINRLTLLKLLVDKGHAIGSIAKLNNGELSQRLEFATKGNQLTDTTDMQRKNSVVAIGDVLSLQLEYSNAVDSNFYFSGIHRNEEDFNKRENTEKIDILVMEFPTIQSDHELNIERLYKQSGANQLVLIYGFMNNSSKKKLGQNNIVFFQAPISVEHLRTEIRNIAKSKQPAEVIAIDSDIRKSSPKKTYTTKQLIQLSSASSTIKCECPQHLSSIINKLLQFEAYSEECITRYKKDAELHRLLGNMTGHARSILEKALTEIVTAEEIVIDN